MSHFASVVIVIALGAVLATLILGLFSMARGGSFDAKWANKLMRLRVLLQAIAIALIAIAFLIGRG